MGIEIYTKLVADEAGKVFHSTHQLAHIAHFVIVPGLLRVPVEYRLQSVHVFV